MGNLIGEGYRAVYVSVWEGDQSLALIGEICRFIVRLPAL